MRTAAVEIGHTRGVVTSPLPELSLGEWATLALLREEPTHGWAIVKLLAPAGEVGSVWSLSRPLVYRAARTARGHGTRRACSACSSSARGRGRC